MSLSDKSNNLIRWNRLGYAVIVAVVILFLVLYFIPQLTSNPQPTLTAENESLHSSYADKQVGDRFEFGRYPQGPNGEIQPITWRVLQRDTNALLVISEKGLEAKHYTKKYAARTWEECTLRTWLNNRFFVCAFNGQEQSLIKMSRLSNNADSTTKDYVFLLSIKEAKSLFADDADRMCKPTEYARKRGAFYNTTGEKCIGNTHWWLRSSGDTYYAACVYSTGIIDGNGDNVYNNDIAVRPALRLVL